MIEELFTNLHRPGQYLGNEWNAAKNDFDGASVKFALGFPDLYEVGMSNLGLRIIYGILNAIPGVACERFFAPEADMEASLRAAKKRLFSWESNHDLADFDFMGFSLGSELCYTNVLGILDLAGLPLEASARDSRYPLVIGGGPCALNPEPLADFFDLFVIGEGEEAAAELAGLYVKHKEGYRSGRISKEDLLFMMSGIEGVYAPSLYEADCRVPGGAVSFFPRVPGLPLKIKKRFVKDLNSLYFPCRWIVPYVQTVHDRVNLEVMRGCPNRCRFCQARSQYYPLRLRSKEKVVSLADLAYAASGYEEMSLAGLSVGDYPGIENLVSELTGNFNRLGVNLSLPSLKAKSLIGNLSRLIAKTKKTGLTFAPEAGTPRLRDVLAKDFSEEEFFTAAAEAYRAGYQHLKLYFLIGLPGETEEDLRGIIDFAHAASELKKKAGAGSAAQINISVNPLIPKPHTPLQWYGMEPLEEIRKKQDYLRGYCKNRKLRLNFHDLRMAFLEGVFCRGDRLLGKVILGAYKKGARFDAWGDHFSFEKWLEAFSEAGVSPESYLGLKPQDEALPWDFIDIGIGRDTLACEFNKTIAR
ncbi:MAG: TIGR03960 family B12-binding radical SAM protein [Candidatus Omnitrophica bacterium]|nr:TIGR03960 family B12-binding radical SAM protein [Candidatus Omnitrophota bacterium]